MTSLAVCCRSLFALLVCLLVTGCFQVAESNSDEQKDPHFLDGKRRATAYDYQGAVAAYEKALEANPRSASAHFELGLLFYQQLNDHAAAIYHFDRFLRLRPNADHAENVKQFITDCKQQLAKTVLIGPASQQIHRELEKLTVENQRLRQHVELLQTQLATRPVQITNAAPLETVRSSTTQPAATTTKILAADASSPAPSAAATPSVSKRNHTIQPGDTPATLARKYGVKLASLMAANPNIDPKRLRPGQTLVIPAP